MQALFELIDTNSHVFGWILMSMGAFLLFLCTRRKYKRKAKKGWYSCAACRKLVNYLTFSLIKGRKGICQECALDEHEELENREEKEFEDDIEEFKNIGIKY